MTMYKVAALAFYDGLAPSYFIADCDVDSIIRHLSDRAIEAHPPLLVRVFSEDGSEVAWLKPHGLGPDCDMFCPVSHPNPLPATNSLFWDLYDKRNVLHGMIAQQRARIASFATQSEVM